MTAQIGSVNPGFEKSSKKMPLGGRDAGGSGFEALRNKTFWPSFETGYPHGRKPTAPAMGRAGLLRGSEIQREGPAGTGDARHQPAGAGGGGQDHVAMDHLAAHIAALA